MKKASILILLILICCLGYGQTYPLQQNVGNTPTTKVKTNALEGKIIITAFTDTSAANSEGYLKNYDGAVIKTTTPINALWYRVLDSAKWVQILPTGGGTGGIRAWLDGGNYNVLADGQGNAVFGTLGKNGIKFTTQAIPRFILDSAGILSETGSTIGIGYDPSNGNRLTQYSGGGSGNYLDSFWRVPGIDSNYYRINGVTYAVKDSTGGGSGTPSLTQYRLAIGDASNLLSTNAAITGGRALASDANGVPVASSTTATELGYVNGVTSSIQTQLNAKLSNITGLVTAGTNVTVTGAGTGPSPYVVGLSGIIPIANGGTGYSTYDTTALASFGGGSGAAGDTAVFSTSAIYGSFFNSGYDTLYITRIQVGLQGTSPSVAVKVWYNDSLNVTAGGTALVTAGNTCTDIYTGTSITTFDNYKIPPGVWVWVATPTVTTKPTYFTLTLIGYKKRV